MPFKPPPGARAPGATVTSLYPATGPSWLAKCQLTDKGTPIPNLYNACIGLRLDPAWKDAFHYDEMRRSAILRNRIIEDTDNFLIHHWLQEAGLKRLGLDPVKEAVQLVARDRLVHPVRDWLNALVWDQQPRLNQWLVEFLGADDTDVIHCFGRWFLISMVARIFRPGCQVDHMLVLEGPQGIMKSQACRVLGGDYFSDALPDLTSDYVRVSMHLRGKWLIEVAELSAFSRTESTKLKSFLTQQVEDFTPKFGHHEAHEPRQCVFVGTTNKDTYLRDETGGRRFWPCRCGIINLLGLIAAREQLFAEAVVRFQAGEPWYPDPDFWTTRIKPVQDQRTMDDAWDTMLADWDFSDADRDSNGRPIYLMDESGDRSPSPRVALKGPPYNLIDIARGALRLDRLSKAEEMRLANTLERLGWIRGKKTMRGMPWYPPIAPKPDASVKKPNTVVQEFDPTVGF